MAQQGDKGLATELVAKTLDKSKGREDESDSEVKTGEPKVNDGGDTTPPVKRKKKKGRQ